MIGKLKGTIDVSYEDYAIIDVSGVGYKVYCSTKTLSSLQTGLSIELYIETHVREDHIHLYGFLSTEEQSTFNILQTVKGVGTRMALAILSALSIEQIQLALSSQDKNAFNNVTGVGKKLAERIITELKDKFITSDVSAIAAMPTTNVTNTKATNKDNINDAIAALVSLGISKSDAYNRVSNIMNKNSDLDVNEIIKLALQNQ